MKIDDVSLDVEKNTKFTVSCDYCNEIADIKIYFGVDDWGGVHLCRKHAKILMKKIQKNIAKE